MLHRIQLPGCVPQLEKIRQFQRDVLALACCAETELPLTQKALQGSLGEDRGNWLWRKLWKQRGKSGETTFHLTLIALVEYVQSNPGLGLIILDAFDHDVTFHMSLDDPDFRFQFDSLDNEAKKVLKPLMVSFYEDLLSSGFEEAVHGESKRLNRDGFIESFWSINHRYEVCPACDRQRSDKVDNKVFDDADHFFPKSKYPFLSLHHENLVPLCISCNRSFKGDRDPIDDHNDAPLTNIFHPYERPALEHVDVRVSRTGVGVREIEFRDREGMPSRRVENMKRVFRLQERWLDQLRYHIETIQDDVSKSGKSIRKYGGSLPDRNGFRKELQDMVDDRDTMAGRRIGYVLQKSYLEYVLNDDDEFEELLRYF